MSKRHVIGCVFWIGYSFLGATYCVVNPGYFSIENDHNMKNVPFILKPIICTVYGITRAALWPLFMSFEKN